MNSRRNRQLAIKKLKNLIFTSKSNVEKFRLKMDETFSSVFLPNRVECSEVSYDGIKCDLLMPELYSSRKLIIYIHGGSFVGGSRKAYRPFCAAIAHASSCRVIVPEFRLAPTHPFPASLEDIQTMYRSLYTEEQITQALNSEGNDEVQMPEIYIMADGSGASQALALMHSLNGKFRASVQMILLLSPWLDITAGSEKIAAKKSKDEVLTGEDLKMAGDVYTYEANLSNPQVSPLMIDPEKIKDFPPVYIQMGEKELLAGDAQKYKFLLQKAGVNCEIDFWPDMIYMFQLADEYLEESHLAVEKIGKIIKNA